MPPESPGGDPAERKAETSTADHPLLSIGLVAGTGTIAQNCDLRPALPGETDCSVRQIADHGVGEQPARVGEDGAAAGVGVGVQQPADDGVLGPAPTGRREPVEG